MPTGSATEIMRRRFGDSPERRKAIAEERARINTACLIYEARKKAGLSQKELADKIGSTQSAISRLENTDYEGHTLTILERVAEALDLELEIGFKPKSRPSTRPGCKVRPFKAFYRVGRRRVPSRSF